MCAFKKPATISDWLLFHSSMARTKVTLREREKKGPQLGAHAQSTTPSPEELRRRREEVGWLEELGRSPGSSPTQQLAQMVVEVGPSRTPRAEPASHIKPTVGGKAPHNEFAKKGLMKKPQRHWQEMVALHEI